jgi:hypothetical protein
MSNRPEGVEFFREDTRGDRKTDITKLIISFLFFENTAKTSLKMSPLIFWDIVPDPKQKINITKLIQRMHVHGKYSCSFLTVSEILQSISLKLSDTYEYPCQRFYISNSFIFVTVRILNIKLKDKNET